MTWIIIVVVVVVTAGLIINLHRTKAHSPHSPAEWPYKSRRVLSEPEQVIYHRLVKSLPECIVLAQVELSRVLDITKTGNAMAWHNKISGKSLDFVVCLKDTSVVAAIEIDDKTHARIRRVKADATKNKALEAAGIPLIRWQASALPDEEAIRAAITR